MREFWIQTNAAIGNWWLALIGLFWRRGAYGNGRDHPDRVHIFAGAFASEAEMFAYCFTPVTPNGPEQLNLDLPEASVNTGAIDAAYGPEVTARLSEYFGRKERKRFAARMKPGEALVLIPVQAFEGLDYDVHSTPRLRYLGHADSLAMAASMVAQP